jgi:hypothetical protein
VRPGVLTSIPGQSKNDSGSSRPFDRWSNACDPSERLALTWMAVRGDGPLRIMLRADHQEFATTSTYVRKAR